MRKNDVRKWIHAVLDMLPLLVIPIFAIFVRNENATFNQEIIVPETKVVTFNQLVPNPQPVNLDTYTIAGESTKGSLEMNGPYIRYTALERTNYAYNQGFGQHGYFTVEPNHVYYSKVSIHVSAPMVITVAGNSGGSRSFNLAGNAYYNAQYTFTRNDYSTNQNRYFYMSNFDDLGSYFEVQYNQLFDLTLMFGYGNEPTIEEFNVLYPDLVYDYNEGTKQLLNVGVVTYNDTDVGSQIVYTLYNTVDKYFNFGNVFNFNTIYDWLEINIFNGNAPISAYIVWNVFLYEFLMDLIFLLYALFMFFIDFCTNLIDRFYTTASGGRRK